MQSTLSEDYGSGDSTNGEQDTDNPTKSPNTGDKSPSQSSSSSTHADDEGDSPCSGSGTRGTVETSERTSLSTPQGFMRVTRDTESMCARTDLVYVHPLASEKAMATSTIKVRELIVLCAERSMVVSLNASDIKQGEPSLLNTVNPSLMR